jgi:ribosome biogenesis GTPase A
MINWFPGHMKKTMDELSIKLKLVDLVYLLVDARCPISSINDALIDSVKSKKIIVLINKADLTDRAVLSSLVHRIAYPTIIIDAKKGTNINKIIPLTKECLSSEIAHQNSKGLNFGKYRALVLGVPNVGKSTLINRLANSRLKVENRPGVTTSFAWTRLNDQLELMDSPGVMMSKLSYHTGMKMVLIGSIKDDIIELSVVVEYLITYLLKYYPNSLPNAYQISIQPNTLAHQVVDEICKKKGFLLNKDTFDYQRAYSFILKDYRSGKLGLISLDREVLEND